MKQAIAGKKKKKKEKSFHFAAVTEGSVGAPAHTVALSYYFILLT